MNTKRVSRRGFLKRSAATVGAAATSSWVVRSSALGRDGAAAASDRIAMGHIGLGWFGTVDLKIFLGSRDVVNLAVCDVDAAKLQSGKSLVDAHHGNTACKAYRDFREMFDQVRLDAVSIATPDHWHAIPTIQACERGLDVHVEKPLSLTIHEGRAMVEAARRYGRVVQTGSEARSNARCRLACELVRNGRLGRVKEVYVSVGGPSHMNILPAEPVPPELDWDLWLGPAPWRPYNHGYHPVAWRGFYDFSGGGLTDWGAHHFDLAQWALGMDDAGPVEIHPPDGKEHPLLTYTYANGVRVYHVLGDAAPVGMLAAITVIGTEGRLGMSYGGLAATDPPSLALDNIRPDEVRLHRCPPGGHEVGDFLTSVRTRARPGADVEIGHRTATVCHLGGIAYRLGRPLRWDPVKEAFLGDEEANRLRARAMREPWRV